MERREFLKVGSAASLALAFPALNGMSVLPRPHENAQWWPGSNLSTFAGSPDLWAFRIERSFENEYISDGEIRRRRIDVAATGVLVVSQMWRDDMTSPRRCVHVERHFGDEDGLVWHALGAEQILAPLPGAVPTIVMAFLDDTQAMRAAVEIGARHAAAGSIAVVLAAQWDAAGFDQSSIERCEYFADQLTRRVFSATGGLVDVPMCLLHTITFDPLYHLAGGVKRLCSRGGLVLAERAEIGTALGVGRAGWSGFGVAHGAERAANATASLIGALRRLGADPRKCTGALVQLTSGLDLRLGEMRQVRQMLGEYLHSTDWQAVVLDHEYRAEYETFLTVDVMMTSGG